ncbi:hypothetical protein B0H11DRAFT_2077000 [Mycena galericulata]|nr:hypothetical protein B0H11DRAFT_2077000 [Mycena galericulata]
MLPHPQKLAKATVNSPVATSTEEVPANAATLQGTTKRGGKKEVAIRSIWQASATDKRLATFTLPRARDKSWADFLDSEDDPVPVLPPMFLGFTQPSGEVHVVDGAEEKFVACPGQDNVHCVTGNSPFQFSAADHFGERYVGCAWMHAYAVCGVLLILGPYFGDINFGQTFCSA